MTLTGTWATNPAGTPAVKWTAGEAPARHRHKPARVMLAELEALGEGRSPAAAQPASLMRTAASLMRWRALG
jgi:hypothetical protein